MQAHITGEVTHYKGQCYAWDVVNEALNDNGTFRTDVFYNIVGKDYIRIAFETAAVADPSAKLYYNDFNIETAGEEHGCAGDGENSTGERDEDRWGWFAESFYCGRKSE
jgi:endo-1,4-beta-xylanase